MSLLILTLTALLAVATLAPISRNSRWWVRVLDFPRLQLLFLACCTILAAALFAEGLVRFGVMAVSLCCLGYQIYWIYPYTGFGTIEVPKVQPEALDPSISIVIANVLMTNRNADKLIELVRAKKPDVLLTLESDKWWEECLATLEDEYPFRVKCPLDNLYGMHLYSKLPLHEAVVEFLVAEEIPSIHTEIELTESIRIRAHFLHPQPPVPEYSDSSIERDAELIVVAKSLQDCDLPTIVAGDLNDVAWSETTRLFRKISGLLDPRVGRGMYNTFNANHWFLRWPLDHLFHSDHFQLCNIERLARFGSDHFAFYTKLTYVDTKGQDLKPLSATQEDEEFAADKIGEQDVRTEDVPLDEGAK